ncbi:MAG: lysylphosphatidylglycerol synthase transmembrane domain-containing protein [Eubacteriales bacterium]
MSSIDQAKSAQNPKKKKWLGTLVKVIISVILLTVLVLSTDIGEIGAALTNFQFIWLIPVLLTIALSVIVSAFKWGVLLRAQGVHVSVWRLFCYYVCGLFFNNFLPSSIGGDGARAILAGKESGSVSGAAASVVMERILATVTLSVLGLIGAVFAQNTVPIVIILMSVLFVVGASLALVQMTGWVPRRFRDSEKKVAAVWKSFAQNSAVIRKHPSAIVICLLESLVFQFFVALVVGTVMAGLGLPALPIADLCMVVSASSVLAMLPVGLNGYGLREGSYAFLLAPYGYTTAQALTISVLYALFVTLFSLAGGPLWLVLKPAERSSNDNKQGDAEHEATGEPE